MKNRFNHWLPRWFGRAPWAVTIGQTSYFTEPQEKVDRRWLEHEDCHKRQWAREGRFRFLVKYLWYQYRFGYDRNPYEVEARQAAASVA